MTKNKKVKVELDAQTHKALKIFIANEGIETMTAGVHQLLVEKQKIVKKYKVVDLCNEIKEKVDVFGGDLSEVTTEILRENGVYLNGGR